MLGGDSQEGSIGGAEYLTKALKRHGVDAEAHLFPRSRIAMTPWRVRMGRVVSGEGGKIILSVCDEVLKTAYPDLAERITLVLPDEQSRRVGQSVAAASLPVV